MASSKDICESDIYAAGIYAAGIWRGVGIDVSVPGETGGACMARGQLAGAVVSHGQLDGSCHVRPGIGGAV